MLKCKEGTYNPEVCCDENDIGTQCVAPCLMVKTVTIRKEIYLNKVLKKRAARILIDKLRQLNKERARKRTKWR